MFGIVGIRCGHCEKAAGAREVVTLEKSRCCGDVVKSNHPDMDCAARQTPTMMMATTSPAVSPAPTSCCHQHHLHRILFCPPPSYGPPFGMLRRRGACLLTREHPEA